MDQGKLFPGGDPVPPRSDPFEDTVGGVRPRQHAQRIMELGSRAERLEYLTTQVPEWARDIVKTHVTTWFERMAWDRKNQTQRSTLGSSPRLGIPSGSRDRTSTKQNETY